MNLRVWPFLGGVFSLPPWSPLGSALLYRATDNDGYIIHGWLHEIPRNPRKPSSRFADQTLLGAVFFIFFSFFFASPFFSDPPGRSGQHPLQRELIKGHCTENGERGSDRFPRFADRCVAEASPERWIDDDYCVHCISLCTHLYLCDTFLSRILPTVSLDKFVIKLRAVKNYGKDSFEKFVRKYREVTLPWFV